MKKQFIYLLLATTIVCFQSCLFDEKEIFDDSAANRMTKALKEYNEILIDAPNGWLVEYYAEKHPKKMGGYNFIWNFKEGGIVKMAVDARIKNIEAGEQVSSQYDLIADQGPVLTFNTYNDLLHYFTEPHGSSDLNGYDGDFEFVIYKASPDTIMLTGKKGRNTITMTPLPANVNQTEYLKSTELLYGKTLSPRYSIEMNGEQLGYASQNIYKCYTFLDNEEKDTGFSENVIFNTEGFKFYNPIAINGVVIKGLKWVATGETGEFVTKVGNNEVKFIPSKPSGYVNYHEYIGLYDVNYDVGQFNRTATVSAKVYNQSFEVKGLLGYPIELKYNFSTGVMEAYAQYLPYYHTAGQVRLCLWAKPGTGTYTWGSLSAGIFIKDPNYTGLRVEMKDNKMWGTHKVGGLLLRYFERDVLNSSVEVSVTPDRIAGPIILTKQ